LKLIFYSTAPHAGVGYGVLTRALVKRMTADGHQVKVATKHHIGGQLIEDGIEVFDGMEIGLVNTIAEEENYDYIITAMDVWPLPTDSFKKWVAINFLDVEMIFPKMIENLKKSQYQIAITEHGKRELDRVGYKPFYAPLGVDTKLFYPDEKLREEFRAKKKWGKDTFVIGVVGINYGTDRKNIIGTLRAFQGFHKRHPNSKVYLHTDILGSTAPGIPLQWLMNSCGFESTGVGPIEFVNQKEYHLFNIAQEEVANLYRAFDVFCLPSHGEGFGLPWLEAQASGTPLINVDNTSGKQLNFGGFLIPALEDFYNFSTHLSWYVKAPPSAIDEQLELAYQEWEKRNVIEEGEQISAWDKRKLDAFTGASEYDWDLVYKKYWKPILDELGNKTIVIPRVPNYGTEFYEEFTGRALMVNCWACCKDNECKKLKQESYPLLPGEWEGPQPILQRSYPVIPDKKGNLLVDTSCHLYKWLSPRFLNECRKYWEKLMGYALIRNRISELWDSGYFSGNYVSIDALKDVEFDEGYKQAWQSNIFTTFDFAPEMLAGLPQNAKIVDVGTGDGRRVQKLIDMSYKAIGTEVNKSWINSDDTKVGTPPIYFGDGNNLPFKDNEFDMVVSVDVLEHMVEPLKAISELFRVSNKYVLMQITSTENKEFFEDPTHKVLWDLKRWQRELMEFSESMTMFKNNTFLLTKKIVKE